MRKNMARIMIVLGLILFLLPTVGGLYTKYEQQKLYKVYLEELSHMEGPMDVLNDTLDSRVDGVSEANEIEGVKQVIVTANSPSPSKTANGVEVIGFIMIPKIDVTVMLVEGIGKQALKFAVGHMPGTGMPGEVGNAAIAGHRSYTFGEYFNRLDEVEIGDELSITIGKEQYTYRVYESFLVEPTEISVIESQGDKKVVTLITCHPVVKATHRLIVRGELVEE